LSSGQGAYPARRRHSGHCGEPCRASLRFAHRGTLP
jgi:hypothetical protein